MKLQAFAIIFIILILPISIIIGEYASFQIETFRLEQLYDSRLITATHDALKTFQINTFNDSTSDIVDSKINIIDASANAFYNSIGAAFGLQGYSKEYMQGYIPALVYTMYDGYYIYSPYTNIAETVEIDSGEEEGSEDAAKEEGLIIDITRENENVEYGFKPYIYYSCRYKIDALNDFIINYSLDNYITVQGTVNGENVYKSGYLVTLASSSTGIGLFRSEDEITGAYKYYYNGQLILAESNLTESLVEPEPDADGNIVTAEYKYVKLNGTKYYLNEKDEDGDGNIDEYVFYLLGGVRHVQASKTTNEELYNKYLYHIEVNRSAINYYKSAFEFTTWIKENLSNLTLADAETPVPTAGNDTDHIFIVNNSNNPIEYDDSNFNLHRKEVIRYSIESNLSVAIANFNTYANAGVNFQMPELKETEWEMLENEVSIISFLQGLNIGGKIYNGYTVVTNSKTEELVNEESIYVYTEDGYYHKINDKYFLDDDFNPNKMLQGILDLDFEVRKDAGTGQTYVHKSGLGSYSSIVGQESTNNNYETVYEYLNSTSSLSNRVKQIYYTALARERWSMYKIENSSTLQNILDIMPPSYDYQIEIEGLIRHYDAKNVDGFGNTGNSNTRIWTDLSGHFNGIMMDGVIREDGTYDTEGPIASPEGYVEFDGVKDMNEGDWVNIGEIKGLKQVTLETSFMLKEVPGQGEYYQLISNSNSGGLELVVYGPSSYGANEEIRFYIKPPDGSEKKVVRINQKLYANVVYNVAATYDGNVMALYLNGELKAATEYSGGISEPTNNTVMALGVNPEGNTGMETDTGWANIKMYVARIYDVGLSAEQINSNYIVTKVPVSPPIYQKPTIYITDLNVSPNIYLTETQKPTLSANISVNSAGTPITSVQYAFTQSSADPQISDWIPLEGVISADGNTAVATVAKQVTAEGIWYLHVKATSGTENATSYAVFSEIIYDNIPATIYIEPVDGVTGNTYEIPIGSTAVTIVRKIYATDDSGVSALYYLYTTSEALPAEEEWQSSSSGIVVRPNSTAGTYYLHVKAVDMNGNTSTRTEKYIVNQAATYTISITNTGSTIDTTEYKSTTTSIYSFKKTITVTTTGIALIPTIEYAFLPEGTALTESAWETYSSSTGIVKSVSAASGTVKYNLYVRARAGSAILAEKQQTYTFYPKTDYIVPVVPSPGGNTSLM